METWNREELYREIWEQPLIKLAAKYGISAVALGKVCRKLQILLPGRGHWTKKEFGKSVERLPLPEVKNLPVVHRFKFPPPEGSTPPQTPISEEPPKDPDYLRIVEFESRQVMLNAAAKWHPLVKSAERILKQGRTDERGILQPPLNEPCLDLRVSKESLGRALVFINAVILALEAEGFSVTLKPGKHETGAQIFGHRVHFAMAEKAHVVGRREVKEYSWTRTVVDYKPTGVLEFRIGDYDYGQKFRDGKTIRLEDQLSSSVAALLHKGRSCVISAKLEEQRRIELAVKEREREVLAKQIAEEEKKVTDLEAWAVNWGRAQQIRDFIAALEKVWAEQGYDLSPDAEKGQRIIWMKQQADRLDPMVSSPPSILDRKPEIARYS